MKTWKTLFINGVLATGLLMSISVAHARNPAISSWIRDLSYTNSLEPAGTYWSDEYSNLSVAGMTVHVLWYSRKDDWTDERFVYRRSTNNGATSTSPKIIASKSEAAGSDLIEDTSAKYLCVTGTTVYIVIPRSFPASDRRNWYYNLYYYRSTDNGATFEPARRLVAGADVWHITQPRIACNTRRVVVGYHYRANWYANYQIRALVSENDGNRFRSVPVVTSGDKDGGFEDLALSGTDVYFLYWHLLEPYYYGNFQARIGVASSNNDSHTFNHHFLTTPATDRRYYGLRTKDIYNSPDLAVVGSNVHVIWNQLDTNYQGTRTLMYARSLDKGVTFGRPRKIFRGDTLYPGQEMIAARGSYVYMLFPTTDNKIRLSRSADRGSSLLPLREISSAGGWWPELGIDRRDATGASVYAFWDAPTLRHSIDGGKTFSRALWTHPVFSYNRLHRSQFVVGNDGALHATTNGFFYSNNLCNGICDWDTFYRRIAPDTVPPATMTGLRLVTHGATFEDRVDNFQAVARTINFSSAITAEVWAKDMVGGIGTGFSDYRTPILSKQRDSYTSYGPAYAIGTVDYYGQRNIVADLHTTVGFHSLTAQADKGLLAPRVWTHLAMTYDAKVVADNFKLYRNGVLIAKTTVQGDISSGLGNLFVGRFGNWVVDEVRLWNRVLPAAEIRGNMGHALTGGEHGLSAYYNFDKNIKDITGKGNDGVLMYKEQYTAGKY